jgi:hypothetical protein
VDEHAPGVSQDSGELAGQLRNPGRSREAGPAGHVGRPHTVAPAPVLDLAEWDAAARGAASDAQPGWYFVGREHALGDLADWLIAPPGDRRVRIVTGRAGSGKTAVLGRLVTLARPGYSVRLPRRPSGAAARVPPGVLDVALIATGKTSEVIVAELSTAAGLDEFSGPLSPAALVAEVRRRHDRFTIVVDAINEAARPRPAD